MKRKTKCLAGIFVAAACAMCGVQARAQVNAEQVMNIGRNVLSMDDFMLAIQYFNQAIKAKPYLAEPYYLRAVAKLNLEDYHGAEHDCSLALERNKFLTEAYKLRGYCRQSLGLDSLAVVDYDTGLRYAPDDRNFLFYKAVALTEMDRVEQADTVLHRLLARFPGFEEGYSVRARVNLMRGDTIAALADIDRSVERSKNLINNYLMRADIYVHRQDWKQAAEAMDEVVRLEPQNVDFYVNRAYLRYNIDDYFGAMADYNYALELNPDCRPATYNRALLRLEVRDLNGALADFSKVLTYDPDNFHARYNRALILMDLKRWKQAIADFNAIAKRYPRFYPVYYGIAQARQALGDERGAVQMALYAEDMVRKYVDNPRRNPLDRPVIDAGKSNERGLEQKGEETEIDVMERFNRLVTVNTSDNVEQMEYDDKIKGRVQDRAQGAVPEGMFFLSLADGRTTLRPMTNYFREVEDMNRGRLLPATVYVTNTSKTLSEQKAEELFALADNFSSIVAAGNARPVDWLGRGVTLAMLRDYDGALRDLNAAVDANPDFAAAYLMRAYVKECLRQRGGSSLPPSAADVMSDLDMALRQNPNLIYAWFDKGNVYYDAGDFTSALQCFSKAIDVSPEFAEAYYNRALAYLAVGNRQAAFADLSRAGEMGIIPSYSVLKSMK